MFVGTSVIAWEGRCVRVVAADVGVGRSVALEGFLETRLLLLLYEERSALARSVPAPGKLGVGQGWMDSLTLAFLPLAILFHQDCSLLLSLMRQANWPAQWAILEVAAVLLDIVFQLRYWTAHLKENTSAPAFSSGGNKRKA